MSKKLTTEEFILKSSNIHKNKYSYTKVNYINTSTKVIITCPVHGDWEQLPGNHYKYGCPACANKFKTTEDFINKANKVHNNKYDYSKSVYKSANKKLVITCPEHGDFEQGAISHEQGAGCPKCGIEKVKNLKFYTTEDFITKSNLVHNNMYDYSKSVYIGSFSYITIICPIHGDFEQTPNAHLQGQGCKECGIISRSDKQRLTIKQFIDKANIIHDYTYKYDKVKYVNNNTKVTITCPVHGDFEQIPNSHLSGNGCPGCAKYGFQFNKKAILYYLKINLKDKTLYKIGITNRTVNERFDINDLTNIEVIKQKSYCTGKEAYKEEQKILHLYKEYKYFGKKVLTSHGNTELFTTDISCIDNRFNQIFG